MMRKVLEHISFPALAERVSALYNNETDAILLSMLGQEYVVSHTGIALCGQKALDSHVAVILGYLSSPGTTFVEYPWRALGDFPDLPAAEFRKRVEIPLAPHVMEFVSRANTLLPHFNAVLSRLAGPAGEAAAVVTALLVCSFLYRAARGVRS